MMPGVNQSGAGGIASEATSGTCQNCTVLNESLDEYVAALLTLKQKIIDTDRLLCEYKEKCDELQKSQRESAELHKELDEVLLKLGPLEKRTAEYEAVRAELDQTKATLKVYEVKCEEVDALREENAATLATNSKLQEAIKTAEDAARTQSMESTKLRSEKETLESYLQKTRESLRMSQQEVEQVENLKLQNAKTLILKSNLENQLLAIEDTNLKQSHTIHELKSKNTDLKNSMRFIEDKLATLDKKFNKETKCSSTQTENEAKVDKAKVWSLLQQVWQCVDPLSKTKENSDLNDNPGLFRLSRSPPCPMPTSPFRNPVSQSIVSTRNRDKVSPEKRNAKSVLVCPSPIKDQNKKKMDRKKKRSTESENGDKSCEKTADISDLSLNKDGAVDYSLEGGACSETPDVWEILSLSWSLPALLSPLPPDEMAEMEVDLSLNEGPEDFHKSQSTEPKHLNSVASSSVDLSPGNQPSTSIVTSSITSDTDNKSPRRGLMESQEMHVENMCEIPESPEDSPCTPATATLNNELDEQQINSNQATIITTESQLSTEEEHTNQNNFKKQCKADHELLQTNCNDHVRERSEPVQQVLIPEKSVQYQSEVDANVPGYSSPSSPITPDTCSKTEPEKSEDEIQSVLMMAEERNVVWSGDSSDDEEFVELKRKVRRVCFRPAGFDRVTLNKQMSNDKEESVAHVLEANCNTKDEDIQPEKERTDECAKDFSVIPEDDAGDVQQEPGLAEKYGHESDNLPNNSLRILDERNQQEECVLSGHSSPNLENMDDGLEEDEDEANPKVKSICHASSLNSSTLDKSLNLPLIDAAPANSLTPTQSPESIGKVLSEMGPPLPPFVLPLTVTPPKFRKHLTPNRPGIHLPTCSSTEGPFSLKQHSKIPSPDPGLQDEAKTSVSVTTPSPSHGVPSSPLQFGSETPKHALPVPGRLPSSALNSSPPSTVQENSMQILDTMYPELSAQARTLNILRGNVNLGRAANENGVSPPPVNSISGNKTINSSSTAFKKTDQMAKRVGANVFPKSAKRLRLDTFSPDPANVPPLVQHVDDDKPSNDEGSLTHCPLNGQSGSSQTAREESETVQSNDSNDPQSVIFNALEKLHQSCFDVLPVIRSHVFLRRISDIPVLRDQEKSVLSDFCLKQSTADELILAILSKIKSERAVIKHEVLQADCRVYVGLCRLRGDYQKVHALAYSLLKEDFPEAPKLILFMVTTWPTILSHDSPLCRAVNVVCNLKAELEILNCLSMYLHWDVKPPGDIHETISTLVKALLEDDTLMFQTHDRHGYDLCAASWDYIFSLDLLCSHLGWKWTHDNIIGKELWPVLNTWVTQPRPQQTPVRDICVAAVLRLIGRLGQLGIKEKLCASVHNVAKAVNLFGKHGISEGVPWEVQLSAVYAIYDLSPCNPKEALEALGSWRTETTRAVPSAVTSCITQIGSICRLIKP